MARVFVGLSGGVDSAVSAALLQREGYEVTGVFIKIWRPEFLECTWREDRLDAMRTAAILGLPFCEIDLSEKYERHVIDEMIRAYRSGVTPNPDVSCNQFIKFGAFAEWAFAEGADYIATGHYARSTLSGSAYELHRGMDVSKDQSYFLYRIQGDVLARTLFPVGDKVKADVRSHARQFNLPAAVRPDSQGLCFVGDISLPEFLGRFITVARGAVLDTDGREIGTHDGAAFYTLGQRHGFDIASAGETQVPRYVVAIDTRQNTITVSDRREDAARERVQLHDVHWIGPGPTPSRDYTVETRYRDTPVYAEIEMSDVPTVTFAEKRIASPGQSLVVYDGTHVIGGGIVSR